MRPRGEHTAMLSYLMLKWTLFGPAVPVVALGTLAAILVDPDARRGLVAVLTGRR